MTTLAHTLSGSVIALTVAGVAPTETQYILVALAAAASVDLDHLYFLVRDRGKFKKSGYKGQLHKARSLAHEMFGGVIVAVASAYLLSINSKLAMVIFLAYMIHLVEDFILGVSFPFAPFEKTKVNLFSPTLKMKGFVDLGVIIISVFLWKLYLDGHI